MVDAESAGALALADGPEAELDEAFDDPLGEAFKLALKNGPLDAPSDDDDDPLGVATCNVETTPADEAFSSPGRGGGAPSHAGRWPSSVARTAARATPRPAPNAAEARDVDEPDDDKDAARDSEGRYSRPGSFDAGADDGDDHGSDDPVSGRDDATDGSIADDDDGGNDADASRISPRGPSAAASVASLRAALRAEDKPPPSRWPASALSNALSKRSSISRCCDDNDASSSA
jgi:hypothetical protein